MWDLATSWWVDRVDRVMLNVGRWRGMLSMRSYMANVACNSRVHSGSAHELVAIYNMTISQKLQLFLKHQNISVLQYIVISFYNSEDTEISYKNKFVEDIVISCKTGLGRTL